MPLLNEFLVNLRGFVRAQDGDSIRAWLQVSPGAPQQYYTLASELKSQFGNAGAGAGAAPKGKGKGDAALEAAVERGLPEDDVVEEGQGTTWPGFVTFVKDYMLFWRDVDFDDLVKAHSLLSGLVNSCSTAFANPSYGGMLLKTSMSLSEVLVQLTMMLNKRPDLTSRLRSGDEESRKSVAETSAEIIQKIFTTCLTDRSSARNSRPEGKKVGVYMFANLVLKLLFACRKTHLAKQIFTNISTNSPPLSLYPAAQRVTFLYYLGRFNFSNNHALRAANCLEEAYLQTPPSFTTHRTLILTYLIPAKLLLGLLPSQALLYRPEAAPLAPVFAPLRDAIRKGDFHLYQRTLAAHEPWLFERGILLHLTHRPRPYLWRSLSRRVFLLTYTPPSDPASRKAPLLDLPHLLAAAIYLHRRMEGYAPALATLPGPDATTTLSPPAGGPRKLRPNEGMVWGNTLPTAQDVEMAVATMVQQGLMHGYVAHDMEKFAVMGAKTKGAVVAGWPVVSKAVRERRYEEDVDLDEVPGWVKG
ncbi:related to CSN12 - signalosome component [Cephalotrichum gorgonifer]|uniref:Related to CSN12 - signalosome component n=1 Tax=Cephalotrichum gorgonifer TaxID=2041049 RepID=A0AAE8N706_9PEZI|nr:related to CSN12 - signalosome component [Cephalotrichum gorgonifer]